MGPQILCSAVILGTLGVVYTAETEQFTPLIEETKHTALVLQDYQLSLALELYYLEYNQYPDASGSELATLLFEEGYLKEPRSYGELDYTLTSGGDDYQLTVR